MLEEHVLFTRREYPEVLVRQLRRDPPALRAVEEPYLDKERLVDFFDRVGLFRKRRRQGVQANRPTLVFLNDGQQQATIDFVESMLIDLQHLQRGLCRNFVDIACSANLRVIANTSK